MSDAPWPVVEIVIEACFAKDRVRLATALRACVASDGSFQFSNDEESGRTIIRGISESHIDAAITTLQRTNDLALRLGAPQVVYRETLTRRVEKDYTYKKRTGQSSAFARVKIVFEPTRRGEGTSFVSKVVGGAVPDLYIVGVEAGIAQVMRSGVHADFPLMDVRAILIDGAFNDTDSSALTFEIASRIAFREALSEGGLILLEPIMAIEVTTRADYVGAVVGDLRRRHGRVLSQAARGDLIIIEATVPLANLFGYVDQLKSFSKGQATFTSAFAAYEPCPAPPDPPPAAAIALRG